MRFYFSTFNYSIIHHRERTVDKDCCASSWAADYAICYCTLAVAGADQDSAFFSTRASGLMYKKVFLL